MAEKKNNRDEIFQEALRRVFLGTIEEFCQQVGGDPAKASLSIQYHRVRNSAGAQYDYPALYIFCKGKVKKAHISQVRMDRIYDEMERIKIEKALKGLRYLDKLKPRPEIAPEIYNLLKELRDNPKIKHLWEFLVNFEEYVGDIFPKWTFDDRYFTAKIVDVKPLNKLKISFIRPLKRNFIVNYKTSEGNLFLISLKPLKILEIIPDKGIKLGKKFLFQIGKKVDFTKNFSHLSS